MPTCEDYKQMADRVAHLAIESSAPSVSEALTALALDHMTRAAGFSELAGQQPMQQDQFTAYGD
jgi:hypothetical protein